MEAIYQYFEWAVIAIIILIQIRAFVVTYNLITNLKGTFLPSLNTQEYLIDQIYINSEDAIKYIEEYDVNENPEIPSDHLLVTLLDADSDNKIALNIHDSINSYLLSNYGAPVNFSIIKDMIDREIDVRDDEISNLIPTPLYLGLAATMFGIIIGLLAMPEFDNESFSASQINPVIDGVKYAMIASLSGLLWTTLLSSSVYKSAKRKVLDDKNKQLSYLQAKLLPALIKSEETGIVGFKHSLDNFSKVATVISDNIRKAAHQTSESIDKQLETIEKVENLKMHRVTKANLELFEKLESNIEIVTAFRKNIKNIDTISERLESFSQRTKSIDDLAQTIKINIEDSNDQLNLSKQLTEFLTEHFKKLDEHGDKIKEAVSFNELYLERAIESLRGRLGELFTSFQEDASQHQISLNKGYSTISDSIKEISLNQIEEYRKLYENAPPQFKELEKLDYLLKLDTLNNQIKDLKEIDLEQSLELKSINDNQVSLILNQKYTIERLEEIKKKLKDQEIIDGIDDLIIEFKKKTTSKTSNRTKQETPTTKKSRGRRKTRRFFKSILNPFKKKKKEIVEQEDIEDEKQ